MQSAHTSDVSLGRALFGLFPPPPVPVTSDHLRPKSYLEHPQYVNLNPQAVTRNRHIMALEVIPSTTKQLS